MADTFRYAYLVQMKKTLKKVRKLQLVSTGPLTIAQSPVRPAAFISNGADTERDFSPFPNTDGDEDAKVTSLIRLYSNPEDEELALDQEQLIQDLIDQVKADFDVFTALSPKVYIEGILVLNDPILDLQSDLSIVTLGVDYHN